MVSLSVYIAICQFNNLWLLEGVFSVEVYVFSSCGDAHEAWLSDHICFTVELCVFPLITLSLSSLPLKTSLYGGWELQMQAHFTT